MSQEMTSNKPYLVRAFYEWIVDNDLTPYIAVDCSVYGVVVPPAYITDNQIVLNISPASVGAISMAGEAIEFSARFGGKLEHLIVPFAAIGAIYAKENGVGTALPIEHPAQVDNASEQVGSLSAVDAKSEDNKQVTKKANKGKPSLKVIK